MSVYLVECLKCWIFCNHSLPRYFQSCIFECFNFSICNFKINMNKNSFKCLTGCQFFSYLLPRTLD